MKKNILNEIRDPDKYYRPIPFWSWNEKLDCEETAWQIDQMDKVGIGGYFMHARGGLSTEYMGKDWMDNITTGIKEGKSRGMGAWGYDENGWPSGFGDGIVNGLGLEYKQKYLRYEIVDKPKNKDSTIANIKRGEKNCHFYYEVNPFYVDTLDANVTDKFIETVHERYKKELAEDFDNLTGFFTDEPQVSRNGIPWSFILEDEYSKRYNECLTEKLTDLFFDTKTSPRTRYRFYSLVRDLFVENFMKRIYDWCNDNKTLLTGHMVLEETLHSQLVSNGSCMPHYEYMHIPGMDCLCRFLAAPATVLQLTSVGHQLQKKQMISETFALCGWNVGFEDLKWLYEGQMVRGVNLLCQHLEGYTLRGIRKRDYPATLFYQQPWWEEYKVFNDIVSSIGYLLTESDVDFPVLLLHPQSSAWIKYDNDKNTGLLELQNNWIKTIDALEDKHVLFHLGDDRIIERHGKIQDKKFIVGSQGYSCVVVPKMDNINGTVLKLLEDFAEGSGDICFTEGYPTMVDGEKSGRIEEFVKGKRKLDIENMASFVSDKYSKIKLSVEKDTKDTKSVYLTVRDMKSCGANIVYIVNSGETKKDICVHLANENNYVFNPMNGDFSYLQQKEGKESVSLEAKSSVILFSAYDKEKFTETFKDNILPEKETCNKKNYLKFDDAPWEISKSDPNTITLDYCDCYFDGELIGKNIPVNNIQEMAVSLKRPVKIKTVFEFFVDEILEDTISLVIETPEKFDIFLNDAPVKNETEGYYRDKSFKVVPLPDKLKKGRNEIVCVMDFKQSASVYENVEKSLVFESEKNKLTYDDEIECIYLLGEFGVKTSGKFQNLERNAVQFDGEFSLCKKPEKIFMKSIIPQGFPFFSGKITLKKTFIADKKMTENPYIRFDKISATYVKTTINNTTSAPVFAAPYEIPANGLKEGENSIEIEFTGTLRNLLGPHHLKTGESYTANPGEFFNESAIWCKGKNPNWTEKYCFADFVGELKK